MTQLITLLFLMIAAGSAVIGFGGNPLKFLGSPNAMRTTNTVGTARSVPQLRSNLDSSTTATIAQDPSPTAAEFTVQATSPAVASPTVTATTTVLATTTPLPTSTVQAAQATTGETTRPVVITSPTPVAQATTVAPAPVPRPAAVPQSGPIRGMW